MRDIVGATREVATLMRSISAASIEQSSGIQQLNSAIGQMDQVVQQNAAVVEEAAAASESLKQQAHGLFQAVDTFKLNAAVEQFSEQKLRPATSNTLSSLVKPQSRRATADASRALPTKRIPEGAGSGKEQWQEF